MARAYALYFDAPPSNIDRRARQFLLAGIFLLHLLFIGWVLRTPTSDIQAVSSRMMVELHSFTSSVTSPAHRTTLTNKTAVMPGISAASAAPRQHAEIARVADNAKPRITGQINPSAGDSASSAAALTAAAAGVHADGNDAGQSNGGSGGIHRGFVPPRVQSRWKPPYPMEAFMAHLEGEAFVLVRVAADGRLVDASIDKSSGNVALDDASLAAIRRYTFKAAQKNDAAIEAQAIVSIAWRINDSTNVVVEVNLPGDRRDYDNAQSINRLKAFSSASH
ncbi:energy transducer TonB [Pseudolysobacter antarcticus]|uniref:Energy transducer TonB n=1 Tax=Pseudolysobacter antarcticus TaxID=2511995 RepID=A0A411HPT2_9GAMM|nr:energy transducer TonB [Pseudolysobacter antarcticus]QBB72494.1 energy transducer TonB [Pseudolysobacter antarcticus]